MKRLAAFLLIVLAACGGANEEEQHRFRAMCDEAGGYVLRVHTFKPFTATYECFTGIELVELEGWEDE